ncbi:hypothetical protein ACET3Z_029410 [Daucus carota]
MFPDMNSCNKDISFFSSNFKLQTATSHQDDHNQPHQPSLNQNLLSPQEFHGMGSFLGKRSLSFGGRVHQHEADCHEETERNRIMSSGNHTEDLSDDEDGLSPAGGEKKRRLNSEQVKTLEKNFELGNKLEPDRKLHLARLLGLPPRQIAIWFQNRRVRWKTKQLENDYQLLKRRIDAIKAENSTLQSQNQRLHDQILALKKLDPAELINLNKKTDGSCSNTSENSSDINLDISRRTAPARPQIRPQEVDHYHHHQPQTVKEEGFSNLLCGIDDQAEFWPWLE